MEAAPIQPRPDKPADTAEKPNGPVAAVLLAAGFGSFILGLLVVLAEASESFAESLQYDDGVGPLSGKTVWATVAFFAAWGILTAALRERDLRWKPVLVTSGVLVALGLLGTFPIFFQAFAPAE